MTGPQLAALCQRAFLDGYHGEPQACLSDPQKQAYYAASFASGQRERERLSGEKG